MSVWRPIGELAASLLLWEMKPDQVDASNISKWAAMGAAVPMVGALVGAYIGYRVAK